MPRLSIPPPYCRGRRGPALGGVRIHLRAFDYDAQARGKTKLQVLVATIPQLLHAIYSTFKHGQLFRIAGSTCCDSRLIHTARFFSKRIPREGKGTSPRTSANVAEFADAALPLQAGCVA